ncbi:conserved hypothetical protein [Methylobacterium sp. 4-46]|uniref:hypothetical protein n=1 Tax=unclassified Methylobacterium TaxID=2615210 RepID=UPI000165CCAC|nr:MULTISPECIES: hypothetical protein [Methylobacterium]ACA19413.1 conserved hypothetical protein [Methylobacterium sp. 4-46]WFT78612.1 hypothetical protein QA634_25580 [Methylobacterium nodulans]
MPQTDPLLPRPALTHPAHLAAALARLGRDAGSRREVWRLLTDRYTVDLDAVAAALPPEEPEPIWLPLKG